MAILGKLTSGGRHTVTVTLPIEDESGVVTNGVIKVVYRGVSLTEGEAIEAKFNAEPNRRKASIQSLSETVIEIVDGEEVVKSSPELFGSMDTYFLNRIGDAIQADRQGPNE